MSVVFALATPPAKSAICIFRVSGPGCLSKIPELTGSPLEKNKKFYLRSIKSKSGDVVDRVGIISFKGPDSYTGEDSFEINISNPDEAYNSNSELSLIQEFFSMFTRKLDAP